MLSKFICMIYEEMNRNIRAVGALHSLLFYMLEET
jgi:hypothetical protein